jgi:hypothetical protein
MRIDCELNADVDPGTRVVVRLGSAFESETVFHRAVAARMLDQSDAFLPDELSEVTRECPATKTYSQWERVAHVQLPYVVAYIVLSSRDHASYQKDSGALQDVLKTFILSSAQIRPGTALTPLAAD